MQREWFARSQPLRTALVRQQVFFPDRRLIQFDCGKLQVSGFQHLRTILQMIGPIPPSSNCSVRPRTVSKEQLKCGCH